VYLFVFSVVTLPLFLYLKKEAGQHLISRLAAFCEKRGAIFLLAIPLAIFQIALRARWPQYLTWADFFFWITFFIYGSLLVSDARFERAIARHGVMALVLGTACSVTFAISYFTGYLQLSELARYSLKYAAFQVLLSLNAWSWVVALLSFGIRFLNVKTPVLKYANEAVLPFYILHQTVILTIGFHVVQWHVGIPAKYLVISATSLVATTSLYDLFVRRVNVMRFLFGMRPKRKEASRIEVEKGDSAVAQYS
jgi:hypothetical protein